MKVAEELRELQNVGPKKVDHPIVAKIDSTRDLSGSIYAPGDWKKKHMELG